MAEQGGARSVALVVRLTVEEREAWHAAARAVGRGKTASWVREVVSERVAGGPVSSRSSGADGEVARVRAELGRIGNNVNQIAYQANAGGLGGPRLEYAEVARELAAVRRELGAVRDALRERTSTPPSTAVPAAESSVVSRAAEGLGVAPTSERMERIAAKIEELKVRQAELEARRRGRSS